MKKNDSKKRELAKASKSVSHLQETLSHVKACKAMYVLSSRVRMVEGGQTVVKEMTTYHPTKKLAVAKMEEEYREVTGGDPDAIAEGRGDWVHYESADKSVVATFEIYKPVVG